MGLQVFPERRAAQFPGIAVGVFTFRQQHDPHIQPFLQYNVNATDRRPDACRVAVEQHRNVVREPAHQPDLLLGQSRPR